MSKLAYSVSEIKKELSIGHTTLYELIKSGQLKSHKIGSRTIFKAESVREFLNSIQEAS